MWANLSKNEFKRENNNKPSIFMRAVGFLCCCLLPSLCQSLLLLGFFSMIGSLSNQLFIVVVFFVAATTRTWWRRAFGTSILADVPNLNFWTSAFPYCMEWIPVRNWESNSWLWPQILFTVWPQGECPKLSILPFSCGIQNMTMLKTKSEQI